MLQRFQWVSFLLTSRVVFTGEIMFMLPTGLSLKRWFLSSLDTCKSAMSAVYNIQLFGWWLFGLCLLCFRLTSTKTMWPIVTCRKTIYIWVSFSHMSHTLNIQIKSSCTQLLRIATTHILLNCDGCSRILQFYGQRNRIWFAVLLLYRWYILVSNAILASTCTHNNQQKNRQSGNGFCRSFD